MADGTIIIETKLDTSGVDKGLKELEANSDKYYLKLEKRSDDFSDYMKNTLKTSFAAAHEGFVAIGEALAAGEDSAKAFGAVMLKMLGNVLKGISEELMALAFVELVKKNYAGAAKAMAGAALAGLASGIISGLAGKFENGGIVGGTSYTGDKLLAQVNSGELILNEAQQGVIANKLQGGSAGEFKVVINNNANADVRQEPNFDAGVLEIFIENKILQTMGSRRGASVMQKNYGLNQQGIQFG